VPDAQISPRARQARDGAIEPISVARQACCIDCPGRCAADYSERIARALRQHVGYGAQHADLIRGPRSTTTHDQADCLPVHAGAPYAAPADSAIDGQSTKRCVGVNDDGVVDCREKVPRALLNFAQQTIRASAVYRRCIGRAR
jgi:hypothetical protein